MRGEGAKTSYQPHVATFQPYASQPYSRTDTGSSKMVNSTHHWLHMGFDMREKRPEQDNDNLITQQHL